MTTSQVIVIMSAVLLGAGLKSTSGIGMPFVTVPAISLVASLEEAVIIGALPNLVLNVALAWAQRHQWRGTRDLGMLGVCAFIGGAIGTFLLVSLPERPLVVLLIAIVVAYTVLATASPDFSIAPDRARPWSPVVGVTAGVLQGAIGISGPIVVPWVHSQRLERDAQILSVTFLFMVAGISQFPLLVAGGELQGLWLITLAACVPTLATVPLGSRIRSRLSSAAFDWVVLGLLAMSAVALAVRTFA